MEASSTRLPKPQIPHDLEFCEHYLNKVLFCVGHAVAQMVEALRYKSGGRGSIPDGDIGIFH